ncbi:MAG: hypothetical protein AAFR59_13630 [Bacteroidota bacterium]
MLPSHAQTRSLKGYVQDWDTQHPVRQQVTLWQGKQLLDRCFSTINGGFTFKKISPGDYILRSRNSYGQTFKTTIQVRNQNIKDIIVPFRAFDPRQVGPVYNGQDLRMPIQCMVAGDTLQYILKSDGCFHSYNHMLQFTKEGNNYLATYKVHGRQNE